MQDKELIEALKAKKAYQDADNAEYYYTQAEHAAILSLLSQQSTVSQSDQLAAKEYADKLFDLPQNNKDVWYGLYHGYLKGLEVGRQQIDELRKWKAEAISVMPDYPAIGKAIGVPLGQSIHDKILPAIQQLKGITKDVED